MSARSVGAITLLLLSTLASACSKKDPAEGSSASDTPLVEAFAKSSIAWVVNKDGRIHADVKDASGAPSSSDAEGTVAWTTESGDTRVEKLAYDADAKALVAAGPPPTRDITPLKYQIVTKGDTLAGTLHIPVGGTAALAADAKETKDNAADTKGPHGGVVQFVGGDRLEIVAEEGSDEVRVFLLDSDGKPASVGDRTITFAAMADKPEVVVLKPSEDGTYFVGTWRVKEDPTRITLVVHRSGHPYVAIVGWTPGTRLIVAGGPPVRLKIHVKQNGKIDVKAKDGPGVPAMVKVDDDHGGHGDHGGGHGNGKHGR